MKDIIFCKVIPEFPDESVSVILDAVVHKSHQGDFLHIFVPYDHLVDEDFEDPENGLECVDEYQSH